MKIIASLIFGLFLTAATSTYGQVWREIKPIESTGDDVRRLLGDKVTCHLGECKYDLPKGGTVRFGFSLGSCESIPAGTVTTVSVSFGPDHNLRVSDLGFDESKLITVSSAAYLPESGIKIDVQETLVYESAELGVKVEAGKDKRVIELTYFPAARHAKLFCPPAPEAKPKPPAGRK